MRISKVGYDLIKTFEGFQLPLNVIEDLEKSVSEIITAPINQNQFDALVSFASNMGIEVLSNSQLLKRINNLENPTDVAVGELYKWNVEKGKIFQGLSRRRSAELDLFCSKPPEFKWGWVSITSARSTYFRKRPIATSKLSNNELMRVQENRLIRRCRVLKRQDGFTYLELSFGMGTWWVLDNHWKGLTTEIEIKPYARNNDLMYLRNFPYLSRSSDDSINMYKSLAFCMAMVMKYLDANGINDVNDYLTLINKYEYPSSKVANLEVLADLGFCATLRKSTDIEDIKDNLEQGLPVIATILIKNPITRKKRGPHRVVITGYGKDYWLVQDPFGKVDLINGGWIEQNEKIGHNIRYEFEAFNRRLCVSGGATGCCWLNFRELLK